MSTNKPQAVSEEEIAKHLGVEVSQLSGKLISSEHDDPYAPQPDASAPEGSKTACSVHQANQVLGLAKEKIKLPLFRTLARHWRALQRLNYIFARRQEWRAQMYIKYYEKRKRLQERLYEIGSSARKDVWEIQSQLAEIRRQVSPHCFQPRISFFRYDGHSIEKGSFVAANVDDCVRFNKLPFLLGWEGWSLPAACPECVQELRDFRFKNSGPKKFSKVDALYAQTFKSASARMEELKSYPEEKAAEEEKYRYENEHPEIINLDREKQIDVSEQTSFCVAFLVPDDLSDLDSVIQYLKGLGQKEMDALEVLIVRNRGDNGEREWFGHKRKKSAKPNGWGWAGGKAEANPWREFLDSALAPDLRAQAAKDPFLYNLLSHANREFSNESCHEALRIFGRIARVQKGKNHVVHFWLIRPDREATRTRGEIHEIDATRVLSLSELYRMPLGGLDAFSEYRRQESAYKGHLVPLARFFEKHKLVMPEGMKKLLERLEE